jgi:hypothetical protein
LRVRPCMQQVGGVTAWDFFSHFADPVCAANPECRNLRSAAEFYLLRMLQEYDMMATFLPSELAMAAVSLAARVVGACLGPCGKADSGSESEPDIPEWAATRHCGTRMLSVLKTARPMVGVQKCFAGPEHFNVTALPLPKDW